MSVGCEWWYAEYLPSMRQYVCHEKQSCEDVQPIHPDRRQILDVQRDERPSEPFTHVLHLRRTQPVLKLTRKPIRFPLEPTRHKVERDPDERFHGRQNHLPQSLQPSPRHNIHADANTPGTTKTPPSSVDAPTPPLRNQTRG